MKKPKNPDMTNLEVHCISRGLVKSLGDVAKSLHKSRRVFLIGEFKKIVEQYKQAK